MLQVHFPSKHHTHIAPLIGLFHCHHLFACLFGCMCVWWLRNSSLNLRPQILCGAPFAAYQYLTYLSVYGNVGCLLCLFRDFRSLACVESCTKTVGCTKSDRLSGMWSSERRLVGYVSAGSLVIYSETTCFRNFHNFFFITGCQRS